jgi:hypothetical protein
VTDAHTVAAVKAQFKHPVGILDKNGNVLADTAVVTTGSVVYLQADHTQRAVIVMKGDVNGDGRVNADDYRTVRNYFLKTAELSGVYFQAADCDNDGMITTTDYLRIKAHYLNLFDLFA